MTKVNFTRKSKSADVSIDIKDSNGNLIKTVSFNPSDMRSSKIFAEIIKKSSALSDMLNDKDFEPDTAITVVNILDDIFSDLDKIFGAGTTELLTYGVINEESLESLKEFIAIVMPFYEEAMKDKEDRIKPYVATAAKAAKVKKDSKDESAS